MTDVFGTDTWTDGMNDPDDGTDAEDDIQFEDIDDSDDEAQTGAAEYGNSDLTEDGQAQVQTADDVSGATRHDGQDDSGTSDGSKGAADTRRRKKKKKKRKWIILGIIAAAVVAGLVYRHFKAGKTTATYTPETAQKRDIGTSYSYTGTIEAIDSQSVMSSVTGAEVIEVDVKEGDEVQKGDVIARLDTSDVDTQIAEKQATMNKTAAASSISIEEAQKNLNDLQQNLKDGLDSQVNSALQGIDSATEQLVSAQNSYNYEVGLNNDQLSATILNAMNSLTNAYNSLESAALSVQQAYDSKETAEDEMDLTDSQKLQYDQAIDRAELEEDSARDSYEQAQTAYKVAKLSEENNLTQLFDQLISAQNSYLNAIDNYNTTIRSIDQQIESYKLQIRSAQVNADQTTDNLQLADLQDSLDDYTITAPISGTVTSLDVSEGDILDMTSTPTLATITNYDKMKVSISVSEYDIANLKEGTAVTVTVDALNKSYDGTVSSVDVIGTNSNSVAYYTVEVEFTPDADVMVGMTAEVNENVISAKDAVSVSSEAINTGADGNSFVYVQDADGNYVQKTVTLGATDGSYTQITDGISDGDTVYIMTVQDDSASGESSENSSVFSFGGGQQGGGPGGGGGNMGGGAPGGGGAPSGGGGAPSGGGGAPQ